ncbi:MAG: TSUP family transporter, partial [Microcystis sp.]
GIGGGAIMVPLQMIFLAEKIKIAIVTSLGVVLLNSIAACFAHAQAGHILYQKFGLKPRRFTTAFPDL